jgi:hypothetical protein
MGKEKKENMVIQKRIQGDNGEMRKHRQKQEERKGKWGLDDTSHHRSYKKNLTGLSICPHVVWGCTKFSPTTSTICMPTDSKAPYHI